MKSNKILKASAEYRLSHKQDTEKQLKAVASLTCPDEFFATLSDDDESIELVTEEGVCDAEAIYFDFENCRDDSLPLELRGALLTPDDAYLVLKHQLLQKWCSATKKKLPLKICLSLYAMLYSSSVSVVCELSTQTLMALVERQLTDWKPTVQDLSDALHYFSFGQVTPHATPPSRMVGLVQSACAGGRLRNWLTLITCVRPTGVTSGDYPVSNVFANGSLAVSSSAAPATFSAAADPTEERCEPEGSTSLSREDMLWLLQEVLVRVVADPLCCLACGGEGVTRETVLGDGLWLCISQAVLNCLRYSCRGIPPASSPAAANSSGGLALPEPSAPLLQAVCGPIFDAAWTHPGDVRSARGLGSICRALALAVGSSQSLDAHPTHCSVPILPNELLEMASACVLFCGLTVQAMSAVILADDSDSGGGAAGHNGSGDNVRPDLDTGDQGAIAAEEEEENDLHKIPEYTATSLASLRAAATGHTDSICNSVWEFLPLLLVVFQAVDAMVHVLPILVGDSSCILANRSAGDGNAREGLAEGIRLLVDTASSFRSLLRKRRRTGAREIEEVSGRFYLHMRPAPHRYGGLGGHCRCRCDLLDVSMDCLLKMLLLADSVHHSDNRETRERVERAGHDIIDGQNGR